MKDKPLGKIHAAKINRSERLQKALGLLADGNWHSTLEVSRVANTVCPGTTIQELKANLFRIESRKNGRQWEYCWKKTI